MTPRARRIRAFYIILIMIPLSKLPDLDRLELGKEYISTPAFIEDLKRRLPDDYKIEHKEIKINDDDFYEWKIVERLKYAGREDSIG